MQLEPQLLPVDFVLQLEPLDFELQLEPPSSLCRLLLDFEELDRLDELVLWLVPKDGAELKQAPPQLLPELVRLSESDRLSALRSVS